MGEGWGGVDAHRHTLPVEVKVFRGSCAALLEEWADEEGSGGRDARVADRDGLLDTLPIGVVEITFDQCAAVASGLHQTVFDIPAVDVALPILEFIGHVTVEVVVHRK